MQLALGALGAGVGSMFGMASLGWAVGSAIGGAFSGGGQDIKGPRLTDRTVTTSAFGNMRPLIYGSYRVAGEIIWATDLKEHSHKEEAGKGGSSGSYTSYTYTVSFAAALCQGPIAGVRKIWIDSKLVYTMAEDASAAELQMSEKFAKNIRIYLGSYTQEPDSIMEAAEGAGNVPAYRGTAYIVFEDLDVTTRQGIPQITVEVVASGSLTVSHTIPGTFNAGVSHNIALKNGVARVFSIDYTDTGSGTTYLYAQQRIIDFTNGTKKKITARAWEYAGGDFGGYRYGNAVSASPNFKFVIAIVGLTASPTNNQYMLFVRSGGLISSIGIVPIIGDLDEISNGASHTDPANNIHWLDDYNFYFYKANSGDLYRFRISVPQGLLGSYFIYREWLTNVDSTRDGTDSGNGGGMRMAIDYATEDVYVSVVEVGTGNTRVTRVDYGGNVIESKLSGYVAPTSATGNMAFDQGRLWVMNGYDLEVWDWETETKIIDQTIASLISDGAVSFKVAGNLAVFSVNGDVYTAKIVLTRNPEALDDVVIDICDRVDIDAADIDATDLESDTVRGFMIANQTPARSALEQLSPAFFFDATESDGQLKFIKRGGASIATLDEDDIGCYEGDSVVELWEATRVQEEELPNALTINYSNQDLDYQQGAQHSIRQTVLNGTQLTIQFPIALTDDEAKTIADTMMFSAWHNRHQFDINTYQAFAKIEPTDVITVDGEVVRVVARDEGVNGLMKLKTVRELPAIYTGQVGAGSAGTGTGQTVPIIGPTDSVLLDLPPLRDADFNTYGFYWAANGLLSDWPGATLLRSVDSGDTWGPEMSTDTGAAIGYADTALGDFFGGNMFDELNTVRVVVSGTLESKTRAQVLNGANVAILGDELIQFRTATLVSTGIYDLTGLLRGRMGTEWAMDAHEENERFALLDASSTRFVDVPYTDLNIERTWGNVTVGGTAEDIDDELFTYAGNNLKPVAPVHVGGGTAGVNTDWTIKWTRSSRFQWKWVDYNDVPLDETTEEYEVAIMSGDTIVRTIESTSTAATYTYAQQVTDFGAHQFTLTVKVRQVGAVVNGEWSEPVTLDSGSPSYSIVLLHFDTDFTDHYGHVFTGTGSPSISSSQSVFGGASIVFAGSNYISAPDSNDWNFLNSGDFTIEFRLYLNSTSGSAFIGQSNGGGNNPKWGLYLNEGLTVGAGNFGFHCNDGSSFNVAVAWAPSTATWYAIEVNRTGNTWRFFINGTLQGTAQTESRRPSASTGDLRIGSDGENFRFTNCYIDEFRISSGIALHTANFTPATMAYTE